MARIIDVDMRIAAEAFLEALEPTDPNPVVFDDTDKKTAWSYSPAADEVGISLHDLDPEQKRSLHRLLTVGVSQESYAAIVNTMAFENLLLMLTGGSVPLRDPDRYFIAFFGKPDIDRPWAWRFQGHHLSLNFTIVPGRGVSGAPLFLGTNPRSMYRDGETLFEFMTAERQRFVALLGSLTDEQTGAAKLDASAPLDIVTRNSVRLEEPFRVPDPTFLLPSAETLNSLDDVTRKRVLETFGPIDPPSQAHLSAVAYSHEPKGLPGGRMSNLQTDLLKSLTRVYSKRWHESISSRLEEQIESTGIEELSFAWAGDPSAVRPHYYRIQGPTFLIEYDTPLGEPEHVHTVWRDLRDDFGADLLASHYAATAGRGRL